MTPTAAPGISARHAAHAPAARAGVAARQSSAPGLLRPWGALMQLLGRYLRQVGGTVPALLGRGSPRTATTGSAREPRSVALRQDFHELRRLLDRHALARRAMPHLDRVERTLAQVGSRGLFKLSPKVLEKALTELDAVEQRVRLEELRSRLGSALEAMRYREARLARGRDVEISEASHSLFSELERTWTAPMPLADSSAMPLTDSLPMPLPKQPLSAPVLLRDR